MFVKNKYYWFNSIISPQNCQKIIDTGLFELNVKKKQGINTEAHTHGNLEKGSKPNSLPKNEKSNQQLLKEGIDPNNTYIRDSEVVWLNHKWIYDLILPFVFEANQKAGWNFQLDKGEDFQFTIYNSPGGFYGWHTDGDGDAHAAYKRFIYGVTDSKHAPVNGKSVNRYIKDDSLIGKVRKLSLTLNLNKPGEYEVGNLMFDFGTHSENEQFVECTENRPQGSLIIFPSFMPHCVTPVTKGTRYSLVLWVLGDPFK